MFLKIFLSSAICFVLIGMSDSEKTKYIHALEVGTIVAVETFIKRFGVNAFLDADNDTPLHIVARSGNIELIKYLLEHGADLNARTKNFGHTPLQVAKDALTREYLSGTTPMHWSILENKSLDFVQQLVRSQPQLINKPDSYGITPLHSAVKVGRFDIVKFLIEQGADIQARTSIGIGFGKTPLDYAQVFKHPEIFDYLLAVVMQRFVYDLSQLFYFIGKTFE